ncbi:hypothetical protein [Xylanibacter rarus]|uniref:hypothetical protein n=1 Tax=Xylanibacter rarus TaxID=1676614 RepID=UPI003AB9991F
MDKQTIINRLEALDLSQYPYFEIRELIREFGKVGFIIFTLHPGKTITRARCDGNLKTVSDLSYKPQQYNKQCQRASTPMRTMFYGCIVPEEQNIIDTRFISACESSSLIREGVETSGEQTITFGKWEVIEDIHLLVVIHKDYFHDADNSLLGELKIAYEDFLMKYPDAAKDIDISAKYFAKEFSKKNEDGFDYNYLISAIFTEVVTTDYAFDGVMYPSVQTGGQLGFNVAITPDAVDKKMKLVVTYETQIKKIGEKVHIGGKSKKGTILQDYTILYENIIE